MSYITKSMTIIITLYSVSWGKPTYYSQPQRTREVLLKKQGVIQGTIEHVRNSSLPPVDVYRGIPYAAPPVGELRFMPPASNVYFWEGIKFMDNFGPVCPQKFPDESTMTTEQKQHMNKLKEYLQSQSEDCLYLNIYAPHQSRPDNQRRVPVIVFLHGESFEWNSGNPYDGSVMAAFGQVIVVTLNFRLGILGFLKLDADETTQLSNFGLIDQLAALLWIKDNIDSFGGDPKKVTLLGHGTGAVFASLLTICPIALIGESEQLFHRAILMSGTALADWALVSKPLDVTIQVAQNLNCPLENLAACLRNKRLEEILNASPTPEPYKTTFGPVIDNLKVPNDPKKSMTQYTNIFSRFELMYGVTEMESSNLPLGGDVAFRYGMLENERDEELKKYMRVRCERKPEACFAETRATYNYNIQFQRDQPDRATLARDELLDILSDARTVAPVIQTGLYHSALTLQSYFYVFSHKTHSKEYIRNKTSHGEELPYVFGVPLEDSSFTDDERRLSMTIMGYFSKFAYTGNPEMPRTYYSPMEYSKWHRFDKEWMQFDKAEQNYIRLEIPISTGRFYREHQANFWNRDFPDLSKNLLPWNKYPHPANIDKYENFNTTFPPFGIVRRFGTNNRTDVFKESFGQVITTPPEEVKQSSSAVSALVIVGVAFLLANLAFFTFLYFKCIKSKKINTSSPIAETSPAEGSIAEDSYDKPNCNIVKMFSRSKQKGDDTYDAVQVETKNQLKLNRAMSNSTIDAHAKVREWITNEIVLKYSPKNDRKPKNKKKLPEPIEIDLDQCPTRPVSPEEKNHKPLLIKTASIDRSNRRKRADKVSVAIDATPTGRGPSVLMQQPIELTKSLDYPKISPTPLRRSVTMEDFSQCKISNELRKSITNIDLKIIETEPTIIRIEHGHSKSDPVQDVDYSAMKRLKTFDPNNDINVTSRDENNKVSQPLTAEQALMTIKRRNFPKVLPDYPGRQALINKRRSMPVHNIYTPTIDVFQYSNSEPYSPNGKNLIKFPPLPPPRTTTLGRQGSNPQPVCQSEPMLAEEPPSSPEPEVACNNLYVGPLIPRHDDKPPRAIPRAIITTNPDNPIKRVDPKIIVKPTINRNKSEDKHKHIPRVMVPDNKPEMYARPEELKTKKSQIPIKTTSSTSLNKENNSSSDSNSPSSGDSDTGTVVKRV